MGRVTTSVIAGALIACALALSPAAADETADDERAAELDELGAKLFAAKQYVEAAKLFADSYALDANPSALFNRARCLEEAKQRAEAAAAFRAYLEADPEGAGAAEAEARLLALERELEREREAAAAASAEPASRPPLAPPEPVYADRGRTLRIAGYATAGAGAVSIVAGLAFGARAGRLADELETPRQQWSDADLDKVESGELAETLQITFLVAGSAALVTGAVLAAVGHQRSRVEVTPAIAPGSAGASVSVRF